MQDIIRRVDRCRVCGDDNWFDVISFGATPLANGLLEPAASYDDEPTFPLEVVVCRGCWLMSLRHVVDPEELFRHFVWVSSDSDQMARHNRRIVDWCVEKIGLTSDDLVVEMGSNIGTQLAMFAERGMRVVGVDPARNLAEIANDNGLPTIPDFFAPQVTGGIRQEHGEAALVLGRQCFAHIDDVHEVVKAATDVLAPTGELVIEVPYLVDLLQENQFDTIYHEHLSYFSVGTFRRLFAAHGLRIVDVERARVHGGSVVVFAARPEGRQPTPAVAAALALEDELGLSSERTYREFADHSRRVIAEVSGLVRRLTGEGKRVAGYGAPSKGSTLLQMCELSSAEVEFCTDTTSLKQGKVLPGSHVPIVSPDEARTREPDFYLLLAWNYAEEIIAKEQGFVDRGGWFIVPVPRPRLVTSPDDVSTSAT